MGKITYAIDGDVITKTFADDSTYAMDTAKLPDKIRERFFWYGVKKRMSDCHSQLKTDSERRAMTEAVWEANLNGKWSPNATDTAAIKLDQVDFDKLAEAAATEKDDAAAKQAVKAAVLAIRHETDKAKALKLVNALLARPKIAEAYGWEAEEKDLDSLLGL